MGGPMNGAVRRPNDPRAHLLLLTFYALYATVFSFLSPKIMDAESHVIIACGMVTELGHV
ncbi:hypothetical protein GCM10009129_10190 [Psychrobacter aestuarii]|uniref:MFS transporter n=1 Tax=Psychrobacter aestuarii TaxID=556327 RepID=A0ABN0VRC6_9GAMM